MNVGFRIAAWREHRGMSQRELAKAIGVSQGAVAQWESGATAPTQHNLELACAALGITMIRFYGRIPTRKAA